MCLIIVCVVEVQFLINTLGEPSKKKLAKVGLLAQPGGGGGLTEAQVFVEIVQNQICLGTV